MTSITETILKKRNGHALSTDEIDRVIAGYVDGSVADYHMAALAMAIYYQGMTPAETTALTLAMRDSGTVIDLGHLPGLKVDKHSTGGVGDKVSLCLAPMVVACGVPVPMVSGRGLGHTGGTLDKLEAIPGFKVDQTVRKFVQQMGKMQCSLIGQTKDIAPADKKLYALRDVTGTVESVPLITASILSKKLAEGIDALVLDVKVGRGAFMRDESQARTLAKSIVRVGKLAGKQVSAILTAMDQPLGNAIGNALETREAMEVLCGGGPDDLLEVTYALGAEMLRLGGVETKRSAAEKRLRQAVLSGAAASCMERIVRFQGGDSRVVTEHDRLPKAPRTTTIKAAQAGYIKTMDALELGLASVSLGAGRARVDDVVDPTVGIELLVKEGDKVSEKQPIAKVHVQDPKASRAAVRRIRDAISIGKRPGKRGNLILGHVR